MEHYTENDMQIVEYIKEQTTFLFDSEKQMLWANLAQVAELFQVDKSGISRHIKNIIETGELDQNSVVAKIATTGTDGKVYQVEYYNLDMIIAVGYRVNSKVATEFRKWSNGIVSQYVQQGYVINEAALKESPEKLNDLAAKIRSLRFGEQQVYAKVRECFKVCSVDYNPKSNQIKYFYALLQEKFHYAITRMTSPGLINDRADHREANMGLQSFKGEFPKPADIKIGKNYLHADELYRMHLLSEQFLIFAEMQALLKRKMTMNGLHQKLNDLLTLNGVPVLYEMPDVVREQAEKHAAMEYKRYQQIQSIKERLQIEGRAFDLLEYEAGEYDYLEAK
jgi:hypothetical protein